MPSAMGKLEVQRNELGNFKGTAIRTYTTPRCTSRPFGCAGRCSPENKYRISDLVMKHGGTVSEFYNVGGWCFVND